MDGGKLRIFGERTWRDYHGKVCAALGCLLRELDGLVRRTGSRTDDEGDVLEGRIGVERFASGDDDFVSLRVGQVHRCGYKVRLRQRGELALQSWFCDSHSPMEPRATIPTANMEACGQLRLKAKHWFLSHEETHLPRWRCTEHAA